MKFKNALIISHVAFRNEPPYERLEGPFSSVGDALVSLKINVDSLLLPLFRYDNPILLGNWRKERLKPIPSFLGRLSFIKYIVDFLLIFGYLFSKRKKILKEKMLIVAVDPLCAVPVVIFNKIIKSKTIFYCVDYNERRFGSSVLQFLYKKADELSSRYASQVWTVCEALQQQKKERYQVDSYYIPNSSIFTDRFFNKAKDQRTGDKLVWTGSCVTPRQFQLLFQIVEEIQKLASFLKVYFAPVGNYRQFEENCKKYNLRSWHILKLKSRAEWQQFAASCDIGIAVYDDRFESTKYIEPLKIWDFMLCGLPFIISCEPSIAGAVKKSGVAYLLKPKNQVPDDDSLKKFLRPDNLKKLQVRCLGLARKFDIQKKIIKALGALKN